jgi:hypothetical protein
MNLGENIALFRGGVRVKVRAVASYLIEGVAFLLCSFLFLLELDEWRRVMALTEAVCERNSPAIHRKANTMYAIDYPLILWILLRLYFEK